MEELTALPIEAQVAIGILAVAQLGVMAWALLRAFTTDQDRLTLPLVVWLVIIVVVSGAGPIAFLVAGRRPNITAAAPMRRPGEDILDRTIETLYGARR